MTNQKKIEEQTHEQLTAHTRHLRAGPANHLFAALEEELGPLSQRHEQSVRALALLQMDGFVTARHGRGPPTARSRERFWLKPSSACPICGRCGIVWPTMWSYAGTAKQPGQMTRLERQAAGKMTVEQMVAELPQA